MNRKFLYGLIIVCIAANWVAIAQMGFPSQAQAAGDDPDLADESKFGTCEDMTPQSNQKCVASVGNCLEYSRGHVFVIGTCYTFANPPISWDQPVNLLNGTVAKSAKAIESRGWGECDTGTTSTTCKECGLYYCCKAKFWLHDDCPGDETPVTYSVARPNVCDPI